MLRKLSIVFFAASIGFTAYAQKTETGFKSGDKFLSGGINFSNEKTGDAKTSTIEFSPSFGYFISNNVAVGLQLGASNSKTKADGVTSEDQSGFNAYAFSRFYFTPESRFSIFGHAGLGYGVDNDKLDKVKTTHLSLNVAPGISYFLSDHFAIESTFGNLGFSSEKTNEEGSEATKNIDFGFNLSTTSFALIYKF